MHEHREDEQGDVTDFDPALDYIEILGVPSDADATEIKRRYGSRLMISESTNQMLKPWILNLWRIQGDAGGLAVG